MTDNEILADAMKRVLDGKGKSLADFLKEKTKRGFWGEVFAVLPDNHGFTDKAALSNRYGKENNKKEINALIDSGYTHYTDYTDTEHNDASRYIDTGALTEQRVRELIREELSMLNDSVIPDTDHYILCPESETVRGESRGNRKKRDYMRFTSTIDVALWDLLRKEQKKLKTTMPRLLDSILWHRYGKPKLSFEKD